MSDFVSDALSEYKKRQKKLRKAGIIFCCECEYYKTPKRYSYKEPNLYCCRSALVKMSENDFCSKAVRKRGEAE